jgi:Polysaccharide pyruvyl transferase
VILVSGQGEYGDRRRHDAVTAGLTAWLGTVPCAPLMLDTRLDSRDWRLCSTAEAFTALVSRLDIVVTTRLHGLVLALGSGIPVLAVDPVAGTGKVTAQARAWHWPAILAAEDAAERRLLARHWNWCLSGRGRRAAASAAADPGPRPPALLTALLSALH